MQRITFLAATTIMVSALTGCVSFGQSTSQPSATSATQPGKVSESQNPAAGTTPAPQPHATELPAGSMIRPGKSDVFLAKGQPTMLGDTIKVTVFQARAAKPDEQRLDVDGRLPKDAQIVLEVEVENVASSEPITLGTRFCVGVLDQLGRPALKIDTINMNRDLRRLPDTVAPGEKVRGFTVNRIMPGRRDFVVSFECPVGPGQFAPRGLYVIPAADVANLKKD